ncbi:MAG TPA: hypothetical protein VMJ93_09020 [Verrucomicrobiae bacterium]|nr:hypothetical protein [Verrucomicrobiae bacterium]
MAQTFLIFDFGADEEAAQKARHKVEGWKQGFRLGNKMLLKFDREGSAEKKDAPEEIPAKGKKKASAKKEEPASNGNVKLLIRLDFSDHEKLSHHRWVERIPAEEPFKSVKAEIVRPADETFEKTAGQFDSLD